MGTFMRFQQLLIYYESWRDQANQPDICHGLLTTIGYLRRAGVLGHTLRKVREIEAQVRKNWQDVLANLGCFFADSTLPQIAQEMLRDAQNEDAVMAFYQVRDEAQLVFELVKEYTDEEKPSNWKIVGEIRRILDKVDDEILFEPTIIKALQEIAQLEKDALVNFDPDFFWWLPAIRECELPSQRRDEYMAGYLDGMLPKWIDKGFAQHILACQQCKEKLE